MTSIHVQPTFDLATQAEKNRQRAEIADDVAQFLRSGGKVQILGNSPIDRSTISRRQVVEGGHNSRTKKEDLRDATRHVIDCADGGDDYGCGRPMIDALTTLGILEKTGRGLWSVNAQEAKAVIAALSAQPSPATCKEGLQVHPSPGGRGWSVSDEMVSTASRAYHAASEVGSRNCMRSALEAAIDTLAARQPVGAPAYNSAGISLTACQLHEALLMAGDPELDVPFEDRSLVRIFWTETGHSGPGLYCECVDAEEEGCILLDGTAPAIGQSSQAVDLAMPIAMINQALGHLSTTLDDLDSSPDARPGAMVTEAMGCLRQALTGVQP